MTTLRGKLLQDVTQKEVPSGAINGSNTTFTLSFAPTSSDSITVTLDGLVLRLTTDYSVSGTTLTMVTAPATAQQLFVTYQYRS